MVAGLGFDQVGKKNWEEVPVLELVRLVTVTGEWVAPKGTVATIWVAVADTSCAWAAPKRTTLFAAVASKFVPVIVTVAPAAAFTGAIELIVTLGFTITVMAVRAPSQPVALLR